MTTNPNNPARATARTSQLRSLQGPRAAVVAVALALSTTWAPLGARAAVMPVAPINVDVPFGAANTFGGTSSVAFGPNDGLMYAWDGASVLKQASKDSNTFNSIGSVGTGNSDPGPIVFSPNGLTILVGDGYGGPMVGGNPPPNNGVIFSIPAGGGSTTTSIGTVVNQAAFAALTNNLYFVDQGSVPFGTSSVSLFDSTAHSAGSVISGIPGASSSLAVDASHTHLYVGVGSGANVGDIRTFLISSLSAGTPVPWSAGTLFDPQNATLPAYQQNSGFGMVFDSRGFLFVGGPNGITVFNPQGQSQFYDNGTSSYPSLTYDSFNDRVFVQSFGDQQGIYPVATFIVPEPGTAALALLAGVLCIPLRRHLRRSRLRAVA